MGGWGVNGDGGFPEIPRPHLHGGGKLHNFSRGKCG